MISSHQFFDTAAAAVLICSILHTMLPPWEILNEFPSAQRYYKVLVYTVGYVAINGRSTVYQSLSVNRQVEAAEEAGENKASRTTTVVVSKIEPNER